MTADATHDFNLLVSSSWRGLGAASREIRHLLRTMGDERPTVGRTPVKGIIGVKTTLDPRDVVRALHAMFAHDAQRLQFTCRWAPVDLWTPSDLDSMKAAVQRLRDRIGPGQRWRLTIEKHRDARHHREEIIAALAALIPEKVDLAHPDRILCVDLLGDVAAMAVVTPAEVFSVARSRASR